MSKDEVLGLQRSPRPEDFVDLAYFLARLK
jgi:hypothetical protein